MTESSASAVTRHSVVLLAALGVGAACYWLRDILTPLVLAMFLAIMVDGFARVLSERLRVSLRFAFPAALLLSIVLFGASIYVIAEGGAGFVTRAREYLPKLNDVIARFAVMFHFRPLPTVEQMIRQLGPGKYVAPALQGLQGFAANAVFVLVYMGFIFASRRGFARRLVALFPHHDQRADAIHVFERIRNGVEQYLWIQTVTGLIIAVGSWLAMVLVGLDQAVFWAFLIFVICYIPVVGGTVAVLLPPIFALVQFPVLLPAIILLAALSTINFVVGNILLPRMQGESLNMDPVVILLALAVWTAIWGLPGAFLSTPLTVTAMIILAQFPRSRWIAVLLSANGDPESSGRRKVGEDPESPPETPPPSGRRKKKSA